MKLVLGKSKGLSLLKKIVELVKKENSTFVTAAELTKIEALATLQDNEKRKRLELDEDHSKIFLKMLLLLNKPVDRL